MSQSKESISKSLQDQSQLDDGDGETGKRVAANAASASGGSSAHIFQALQYLQKVQYLTFTCSVRFSTKDTVVVCSS